MTSWVTSPASLERHGTIAGIQVRCSNAVDPTFIGANNFDVAVTSLAGHRATSVWYLIL